MCQFCATEAFEFLSILHTGRLFQLNGAAIDSLGAWRKDDRGPMQISILGKSVSIVRARAGNAELSDVLHRDYSIE